MPSRSDRFPLLVAVLVMKTPIVGGTGNSKTCLNPTMLKRNQQKYPPSSEDNYIGKIRLMKASQGAYVKISFQSLLLALCTGTTKKLFVCSCSVCEIISVSTQNDSTKYEQRLPQLFTSLFATLNRSPISETGAVV